MIGKLQGAAKNVTDVKNKMALSSERDAQDPSEAQLDDRRAAELARTVMGKMGLVKLWDRYEMRIRRHSFTEQRHGHGHSMDTAAQFLRAMLEAKNNVNSQYQSWGQGQRSLLVRIGGAYGGDVKAVARKRRNTCEVHPPTIDVPDSTIRDICRLQIAHR